MDQLEANVNTTNSTGELLYQSHFKVRCPECLKLYTVAWAEVQSQRPHFACSSCHTQFSVDTLLAMNSHPDEALVGERIDIMQYSEEITAYSPSFKIHEENSAKLAEHIKDERPLGVPSTQTVKKNTLNFDLQSAAVFDCPKCGTAYSAQDKECKKCGVIFAKLADLSLRRKISEKGQNTSASQELKTLWENVLLDYEKSDNHQNFIQASMSEDNLEYATAKYQGILEVVPHDEIALKSIEKIKALLNVRLEIAGAPILKDQKSSVDYRSFLTIAGKALSKFRFSNLIYFTSAILIVTGLLVPHLRNLIGLGVAILSFVLALRYYFRTL